MYYRDEQGGSVTASFWGLRGRGGRGRGCVMSSACKGRGSTVRECVRVLLSVYRCEESKGHGSLSGCTWE